MDQPRYQLWASRALIGVVLLWNVQCALAFLIFPEQYAGGFALEGAIGAAVVRGMGILFLMWNVPYAVATSHPRRQRVSLYEAIGMQAIGLVGETLLLASFPAEPAVVRVTMERFILFDGGGLALLLLAALLVQRMPLAPHLDAQRR